ncbi:pantothenate kinase [Thermodesulfitimonas autotrophica]|uniref:Type III pantothenate kinase n=1 Tax=Thermodesulfitimonas autotrophica TaxID=1894989 RepID=A0A3N5C0I5_9THEO|nr:type III pantothenate kinase [Thermodesulfitimonas autotrophica]RPF49671.1 pantothenate kinase [Thermodesulfitimonas autotrophica]
MLLVIDIGNTNISVGVFRGEELAAAWRLATRREQTADEMGLLLRQFLREEALTPAEVTGIVACSVVPPLNPAVEKACWRYFGRQTFWVGPGTRTGVPVKTENPREVGADRVVNAAAGYALYGGPLIVVDFGTATTFDVVSAKGEYIGGVIAPGVGISCEALFSRAAKLPRVDLVPPPTVIGRNTVHSMQAGIVFGFVGLVDEIVCRIRAELKEEARVVATGGLADLVARESRTIQKIDPYLTLTGLRLIYERNQQV